MQASGILANMRLPVAFPLCSDTLSNLDFVCMRKAMQMVCITEVNKKPDSSADAIVEGFRILSNEYKYEDDIDITIHQFELSYYDQNRYHELGYKEAHEIGIETSWVVYRHIIDVLEGLSRNFDLRLQQIDITNNTRYETAINVECIMTTEKQQKIYYKTNLIARRNLHSQALEYKSLIIDFMGVEHRYDFEEYITEQNDLLAYLIDWMQQDGFRAMVASTVSMFMTNIVYVLTNRHGISDDAIHELAQSGLAQ